MLMLWRAFQGGGGGLMGGGIGHLPDPGGMLQQAAIMMDAFAVMNAAERDLTPEEDADR